MEGDAHDVVSGRPKSERGVIEPVGQPLNRTGEIGSRRVRKKEMLEALRNEPPASDERIAQDQRRIIPYEAVANRGRVDGKNERSQTKNFFNESNWVGQNE